MSMSRQEMYLQNLTGLLVFGTPNYSTPQHPLWFMTVGWTVVEQINNFKSITAKAAPQSRIVLQQSLSNTVMNYRPTGPTKISVKRAYCESWWYVFIQKHWIRVAWQKYSNYGQVVLTDVFIHSRKQSFYPADICCVLGKSRVHTMCQLISGCILPDLVRTAPSLHCARLGTLDRSFHRTGLPFCSDSTVRRMRLADTDTRQDNLAVLSQRQNCTSGFRWQMHRGMVSRHNRMPRSSRQVCISTDTRQY